MIYWELMTATDYIVIGCLIYFFFLGWHKGFLRIIFGPIALTICCIIGLIYFKITQDLIKSLLISILGPIVLNLIFLFALKTWRKATNQEKGVPAFSLGRLAGATCCLFWRGTLLILTAILLTLIPFSGVGLGHIKTDIASSKTYQITNKFFKQDQFQGSLDITSLQKTLQDPEKLKRIEQTQEYKDIMEDSRVQALLNDENVIKMIEKNNFVGLMENQNLKAIIEDKELLQKFLAFNKRLLEEKSKPSSIK